MNTLILAILVRVLAVSSLFVDLVVLDMLFENLVASGLRSIEGLLDERHV